MVFWTAVIILRRKDFLFRLEILWEWKKERKEKLDVWTRQESEVAKSVAKSTIRCRRTLWLGFSYTSMCIVYTLKLCVFGALSMSFCFFILTFTLDYSFLSEFNVVIVFIYLGIFTNTLGQVPWFYSSLIMPDKAVSLAVSLNFFTAMSVVLSFPYIIESIGIRVIFILYCIFNGISAIYFCYDMVDSSKMNSYQIRNSLSEMK